MLAGASLMDEATRTKVVRLLSVNVIWCFFGTFYCYPSPVEEFVSVSLGQLMV